ncbi:MAG: butyrate kinase [Prevotellaceae bacterium]|jgi:butyrate kinase|nr:butyrate kinase [Prevotellaceae bacterium]
MDHSLLLAINPGSTSTKIAVFENGSKLFQANISHSVEVLKAYKSVVEQLQFRKNAILAELKAHSMDSSKVALVVGRGGLVKPIKSGVYEVNEALKKDLTSCKYGEHASNLGALIADDIAGSFPNAKAYIVDPVVVDELDPVARVTGIPSVERRSIFHALNQKSIARRFANEQGKSYENLNLVVAHLGGGVSVGAHRHGNVVDVNNALDGDGPMAPERSGSLPAGQLVDLCYGGKYTWQEMRSLLTGKGGLVAHLGTNSGQEVVQRAQQGDAQYKLLIDSMSYQTSKWIGAMAAVLQGRVDAILITGGLAYNACLVDDIRARTEFIAPIHVYPGEDEMSALAHGVIDALEGIAPLRKYE